MTRRPASRHGGRALAAAAAVVACGAASAHVGDASAEAAAWLPPWTFEPWVVACLAVSAVLYGLGTARLWRQAGRGRGVRAGQVAAFAGGWLALVVALVSPLDALGGRLFSAHMLQHELLMVVAAPLFCLARPLAVWVWALPATWRPGATAWTRRRAWRAGWGALTAPLAAWCLHAVALWAWHVPSLFDAALADNAVHTAQHASFFASALVFWWAALRPLGRPRQGGAVVYLFTTMIHTSALGALLTLSPVVWYLPYQASAAALGWDALEDQQLGGLVMWVPAGAAYVVAGMVLAARWIGLGRGASTPLPPATATARGAALPAFSGARPPAAGE